MTSSGLTNADLELVRRIRRIAEMLAELIREYEVKPNPQDLASIQHWAAELTGLLEEAGTVSPEGRSGITTQDRRG